MDGRIFAKAGATRSDVTNHTFRSPKGFYGKSMETFSGSRETSSGSQAKGCSESVAFTCGYACRSVTVSQDSFLGQFPWTGRGMIEVNATLPSLHHPCGG
jgi:hypothetical protein